MFRKPLPRFRFSLKALLILMLGIAIGYSLNVQTLKLFTGRSRYSSVLPPYVIEPPDVLQVDITGNIAGIPQSISQSHVLQPDGRFYLGDLGSVYLAGHNIEEAQEAIKQKIASQIASARVTVDIVATSSKVYYFIVQDPVAGDTVQQFPITGNETVLDAFAQVGGMSGSNPLQVSIARPPRTGIGSGTTLPVDWTKLARGDDTATNYHLLPGDRVIVSKKSESATAN